MYPFVMWTDRHLLGVVVVRGQNERYPRPGTSGPLISSASRRAPHSNVSSSSSDHGLLTRSAGQELIMCRCRLSGARDSIEFCPSFSSLAPSSLHFTDLASVFSLSIMAVGWQGYSCLRLRLLLLAPASHENSKHEQDRQRISSSTCG